MLRFCCLLLLILSARAPSCVAERMTWGNLTGRFVYSGVVPPKKMLSVTKDQAVFGHAVPDLSLLVHEGNSGVANVVVFLITDGDGDLAIHPSYQQSEASEVEVVFEDGQFKPRVVLMRTTQTMVQRNRDNVLNHATIGFLQNSPL